MRAWWFAIGLPVLATIAIVGFVLFGPGLGVVLDVVDGPEPAAVEATIYQEVTDARANRSRAALQRTDRLDDFARTHAGRMAAQNRVYHSSFAERSGCRVAAENVAVASRGSLSPGRDLAAQWLESPAHRRNIIDSRFRWTGIGVAVTDDGVFAVQVFCA